MKRRLALKQLAVATAAAWILPGCIADPKKISIALNRLQISGDEEELLALLAETLIPETDTPGARSVGAHLFTLVMVDDCMEKSDQEKYLQGLRAFDQTTEGLQHKKFTLVTPAERQEILTQLESAKDKMPAAVQFFYDKTRGYILEGYTASQHFLTKVKPYQLIPGPDFKGCAPLPQLPA